jgi:hypothetical protein
MKYTNLDKIVKGFLIERGYPIHFYFQCLYAGSRGYQELHFDSLKSIKTVRATADEFFFVSLPCDCMTVLSAGIPNGQFVRPLFKRQGINDLPNYDTDGNKALYPAELNQLFDDLYYGYNRYSYEGTGFYGLGANDNRLGFEFIKERGGIQLVQSSGITEIIVSYLTDGTSIDNLTMIDPMATAAIEAFILWKIKENSRAYGEGERERSKMRFQAEHAKLRARKNDLTAEDILAMIRKTSHGGVKI